jgi:DNA-binding NarL/FixJ family response regulator
MRTFGSQHRAEGRGLPPLRDPARAQGLRVLGRFLGVSGLSLLVAVIEEDPRSRARIRAALAADSLVPADPHTARPDVCVMSWEATASHAVAQLRWRIGALDTVPLVVVSRDPTPAAVRRLVREGAAALILENDLEDTLPAAVRAAAVGLTALPAGVRGWAEKPSFSHREIEILRLVVAGRTNAEIGLLLCLAESTVKSHLSSAFRKLGVGSRQEAARMLLDPEQGLSHVLARGAENGDRGSLPGLNRNPA